MRPRNGSEVFVSKFQLNGARMNICFSQTPRNHFCETHQRGFDLLLIGSVLVVSMFVADGLGISASANFRIEPSAGVFAPCLPCQSQSPLAEMFFQKRIVVTG